MAFKGFSTGVEDKINSWYLPKRLVDRLKSCCDALKQFDNVGIQQIFQDMDGWFLPLSLLDDEKLGDRYIFKLRIKRNDMDFWIGDVSGFGTDKDDEIIWDEDPTGL
jgi:hypothetical protein